VTASLEEYDGGRAPDVESRWARGLRWVRLLGVLLALLALAAAWRWTGLRAWTDPDRLAEAIQPYRTSWVALPITLIVFVLLELVLFPVLVLVFACGVVFGPWLGTLYALLGSIASAIPPFLLGKRLGRERVERWGGATVRKISGILERRGMLAVFLVRKVPAPYTLVNLVCGASPVSLRDFVVGTLLGMGTGVAVLTVLGGQLIELARHPDAENVTLAVTLFVAPIAVVIALQYWLARRFEARG
jgi:phospholipase D1/2